MDQVGRRHLDSVELPIFIGILYRFRAAVTVFSDTGVYLLILPKGFYPRCQDQKFSSIRDRHSCPVDRFISNPGTAEFRRIQPRDNLFRPFWKPGDVLLFRKSACRRKRLPLLADIETVEIRILMFLTGHRQHECDFKLIQEIFLDIVKDPSHRRIFPSHDLLDSADGADHMGLVAHVPAADSHQQVFRVICHSHHLMGNHLTDGYDPVKLSWKNVSV